MASRTPPRGAPFKQTPPKKSAPTAPGAPGVTNPIGSAGRPTPPPPRTTKKKQSGPPSVPPPPPSNPKNVSKSAAFNGFINQHPIMRPYADTIAKWANFYGVDPTVMAALFWRESFSQATADGRDPATITSPTGAGVGIGQINPIHVGQKTPWGATVTESDLTNPEFNIRWSTWFFGNALSKYGNIDDAYSKGYNPGYTGTGLTTLLPKNYVPSSTLSPGQKASAGVETGAAKSTLTDPWVVLTKDGQIAYVNAPEPPKNVLTYGGAPVSRNGTFAGSASFNSVWNQTYADQFQAFTGRPATPKEIKQILAKAPSVYTLQTQLAGEPGFKKSPVWKANAGGLIGEAKQIMGNNYAPPDSLISEAIVENWTQADFDQKIRSLPAYKTSVEYKTNYANLEQTFEGVYGSQPDPSIKTLLDQATTSGWSTAEFQSWLMNQDAYKQSPSYQAKMQTFLTQMGLITGAVPTLSQAQVDQMLQAGDKLSLPGPQTPVPGRAPGAPGATPQTPVDKPTGVGSTGYGATFTPTTMILGEQKNQGPFTRKVA